MESTAGFGPIGELFGLFVEVLPAWINGFGGQVGGEVAQDLAFFYALLSDLGATTEAAPEAAELLADTELAAEADLAGAELLADAELADAAE